ncbi:hypothetical protein Golob_014646 [Gossypium lobatum]|uniref:DUF4283 domain-containing protein n=1 Tax=Gossypium lobatum TaxID=34289 RepID=A0A7J8LYQ0_9ROSI|nr:hypothetical protein [Gossypium lobatum]
MFRIGPSRKGIRPRASCGVGHNPKNTVMMSFQSLTPASCKREQAKTTMRIEVGRPRPDEKRAWFDGIPATQSQTELGRAGGQRDSGRSHHQQKMKKEVIDKQKVRKDDASYSVCRCVVVFTEYRNLMFGHLPIFSLISPPSFSSFCLPNYPKLIDFKSTMAESLTSMKIEDEAPWRAMRNMLANLLHPLKMVAISYIGEKIFLFKFFYEINLTRVIEGGPWTFNNHLLVFHCLLEGVDPLQVPLFSMDFWIQIHDLSNGLFNETMQSNLEAFSGLLIDSADGKKRPRLDVMETKSVDHEQVFGYALDDLAELAG